MPGKKAEMKKDECCEMDEHECCCCCCPIGRLFCKCGHHEKDYEMPEFMDHFMSARKEMLMGVREMLDWKIEKMESKMKKRGTRRVKKVDIK